MRTAKPPVSAQRRARPHVRRLRLRSFRERAWQSLLFLLIGLLMSTFVFSVFALARIDSSRKFAPTLTIDLALLLALLSVFAIVIYLDHISRQQYVGGIMERVARETEFLIEQLPYGPNIGMPLGDPCAKPDLSALGEPLAVHIHQNGWVQQLSRRALVAACPPGSVIRLSTRVGAYVNLGVRNAANPDPRFMINVKWGSPGGGAPSGSRAPRSRPSRERPRARRPTSCRG